MAQLKAALLKAVNGVDYDGSAVNCGAAVKGKGGGRGGRGGQLVMKAVGVMISLLYEA